MNALSAIELVLSEAKRPLSAKDIADLALSKKYWVTMGKTPWDTVSALLSVDIKSKTVNSKFQRTAPNLFALRSWGLNEYIRQSKKDVAAPQNVVVTPPLADQIEAQNAEVLKQLHSSLSHMSPKDFEHLIRDLLIVLGFEEVEVTTYGGDGGIDVRGTLVVGDVIKTRMAIQVKRWSANVHSPIVQQVRGSLGTHEQGLIITTSDFSSGARIEAARANAIPVALMNGSQLVNLLAAHNVGIRKARYELLALDEIEEE